MYQMQGRAVNVGGHEEDLFEAFRFLIFSNYEQVATRVADSAMLRVPLIARASVTFSTQEGERNELLLFMLLASEVVRSVAE